MNSKDRSEKTVSRPSADIDQRLKKPTAAIVIKPVFGKLTAQGRKLLNILMFLAQKQIVAANKIQTKPIPEGYRLNSYSSALTEILDLMTPEGAVNNGRYGTLQQNIRNLQMVRLEWSSPDVNGSTTEDKLIWVTTVLLASARIYIEGGIKKLGWSFSYEISQALDDPQRFTSIYVRELSFLNTYCAVALYEICARYRDNPSKTTSLHTPEWWIEALSGDSKINSIKQINSKIEFDLISWRHFRRDYLKPAIELINKFTSLQIESLEIKEGKSVTGVQFKVLKSDVSEPGDTATSKNQRSVAEINVLNRGVSIGLTAFGAAALMDEYGIEPFIASLNRFDSRKSMIRLDGIKNIARYIKSILEDIAPKKMDVSFVDRKTLPLFSDSPYVAPTDVPVVSILEKYRNIYASLSEIERERYKTMLEASFSEKNMLSPGIKLGLEKENFGGGVCLAEFRKMIDAGL